MISPRSADEQVVPHTYANHVAMHRAMDAWPVIAEAVRSRKGVAGGFALATFAVVARHVNHRDGETFLSYDTIAKETVTSRSTAYRSVQLLLNCHLLETVGETDRSCNTYRFGSAMASDAPTVMPVIAEPEPAPEPAAASASPVAQRLAADYAKALGRPVLPAWAVTFDTLLGRESEAVIKDTFSWALSNEFWAARIKPFRGDPAKYLAEKWETIREAMSRPVLSRVGRNAPAAPSKMAEVMFAGAKSFKPMQVTA